MNHGIFSLSRRRASVLLVASTLGVAAAPAVFAAGAAPELRLLTHSAFALPKPLLD